jgi:molecular chaperone DnaK
VVRALVDRLARRLGEPIDEVVVTVPALSGDGQRRATREACRIAGLDVVRIMNEPTAAALAYSLDRAGPETVMVFDLGGGTLDVAVVDIGFGIVEVRAVAGEAHLGGDDFDHVIAGHLADELSGGAGVDLRQDPRTWRRLLAATEKAKVRLSAAARTRVSVGLDADRGSRRVGTTLTRETTESLTADLVAGCLSTARSALADAGVAADDLDEVIILGRAARMPAIRAVIRTLTGGRLPRTSTERDGFVARGAAVQAAALRGAVCDALVWDVTPVSLFARTPDGRSTAIVRGNTATPVTRTIAVPGRPAGDVFVVEERGADPRVLGRVVMDQRSARIRELRLMFHVDADGILSASTQDPATGLELPVPIVPWTGPNGVSAVPRPRVGRAADALVLDLTEA